MVYLRFVLFRKRLISLFAGILFFFDGTAVFGGRIAAETGSQRYATLMLLNLSQDGLVEKELIEEAHKYGMNSVYLTIQWDRVYYDSPTATPDWQRYDEQITLATSLGMSVAIRVHVSRSKHRLNGFWSWADHGMKDHKKISHMGGYQASTFRYNYMPAVYKAADFVTEVVSRYEWVHQQEKLIFVSVTNTPEQEAGYPYENFEPDTDHPDIYPAIFECSDQSVDEFREWLEQRYRKISRLNTAWGTEYTSFSEAGPRLAHWAPVETYQFRVGKDWYLFSHQVLKKYTDVMVSAVKSVNPDILYISDYGSVHNRICSIRGTVAFGDLNENSDGVKINDAPSFDHRFTMDVVRGGLPAGAFIANEVFLTESSSATEVKTQIDGNFSHGAQMIAFVASTMAALQRMENQLRYAVSTWQNTLRPALIDQGSVQYSTIMSVELGIDSQVYTAWKNTALNEGGGSRLVKVTPNNDLFSEAYWDVAANIPPHVVQTLPESQGKVGSFFEYVLPAGTFADTDGWIDRIEVSGLPLGLTFDGQKISGIPLVPVNTEVVVVAVDDEEGSVSTPLTLQIAAGGTLDVTFHHPLAAVFAEGRVLLTWATSLESGSDYFEVQRSLDGKTFGAVGKVRARQNADTVFLYQWEDQNPAKGINYYRLKAVDLDGSATLTNIVGIHVPDQNGQGKVFPNPASDWLYVPSGKAVYMELVNVRGQTVGVVASAEMSVSHLASGVYLLKTSFEDGRTEVQRVVVNR